ncbi:MAG: hypothetical protein JNJ46_27735 [Myxococcales bacterium]|nr:hypothetical protein [Myxococcales bacterium]
MSRRRRQLRQSPLVALATLDLSQPAERQAHDFLSRATSKRDRMWTLFDLRRQGGVLLCAVRWVHPDDPARPFALAEVSLTEPAVYWRCYATAEETRAELARRCAVPPTSTSPAWGY